MHFYRPKDKTIIPLELIKAAYPKGYGDYDVELKGGTFIEQARLVDETLIPNTNPNLVVITTESMPDENDRYEDKIFEYAIIAWRVVNIPDLRVSGIPVTHDENFAETREYPEILDKATGLITTHLGGSWDTYDKYVRRVAQANVDAAMKRHNEVVALAEKRLESRFKDNL